MKKTILLARIETKWKKYVPYGLLYVADALRKKGYKPIIVHCHQDEIRKFEKALAEHKKDLIYVGFSCLTGPPIMSTLKASKLVKDAKIPVVWGGTHASILPSECLKEEEIDFIVIGEGECTSFELADELRKEEQNFSKIDGLGYSKNGKLYFNAKRKPITNIDEFSPAYDLLDMEEYMMREFGCKRVLPIITSRGCPYQCGFCYVNAVHGNRWKSHNVSFVLNQANELKKKYKIDGIYWYDDNFFVNRKRGKEIIEKIKLPCFGEIRADYINSDMAKWLQMNNFRTVLIGAESGSERVLRYIRKDLKKKSIQDAVRVLKGTGILVDLCFVTGFPTETEKEREETLNFIKQLKGLNPNINVKLKIYNPYPGTPLWQKSLKAGFVTPKNNKEWAQVERHRCLLPWVNQKHIERMCMITNYVFTIYNKKRIDWMLLGKITKLRWDYRIFGFPVELWILKLIEITIQRNKQLYKVWTWLDM